ncbi:nitroreductase family protein [Fusibacter paucivorans]|uniref:Nitroreductase family protein n=1 Tax=Fusibacter paucivorans TaxID=76009 RepID=A0ABS5PT24_9FIRM|nr:nitroreductase family protein [Fusibacter paucivorans]MBS7528324.1 nitroreductase family protein [Fusibacter paucivorans]
MFAKDLTKKGIVDRDYESVFLGRRCARTLDATHKVSREEIEEIINEAMVATPSAVDSNPYKFLVIDTDEARKKLDDIMWPIDKDRVMQASFSIIPLADRQWIDDYDDVVAALKAEAPQSYEFFSNTCFPIIPGWYEELSSGTGAALDISVTFQAGLVSQSLMIAARAHGLDTGFMDAWHPYPDLNEAFGIDLERYIPQGVLCFGKNAGPVSDSYRRDIKDAVSYL